MYEGGVVAVMYVCGGWGGAVVCVCVCGGMCVQVCACVCVCGRRGLVCGGRGGEEEEGFVWRGVLCVRGGVGV